MTGQVFTGSTFAHYVRRPVTGDVLPREHALTCSIGDVIWNHHHRWGFWAKTRIGDCLWRWRVLHWSWPRARSSEREGNRKVSRNSDSSRYFSIVSVSHANLKEFQNIRQQIGVSDIKSFMRSWYIRNGRAISKLLAMPISTLLRLMMISGQYLVTVPTRRLIRLGR